MFSKEFKLAIENLPSKDKDKLIFRLLKKDLDLANRLYFELVETETQEEKRAKLSQLVSKKIKFADDRFYSVGYLNMDIKYISGDITAHVKTTKDKFGEVSLNLQMLVEVLTICRLHILGAKPAKSYKFFIYVIARAFKILMLIKALDEDYLVEFKQDLNNLGELFASYDYLMKLSINNGFDVNWLLTGDIPEDIVALHKHIRANGFLR